MSKPPHIPAPRKASFTGVTVKKAGDTAALITNGVDAHPDDSFSGSYTTQGGSEGVVILEPTFKPGVLQALTTTNNILAQCVEIMEVNVDGTGHSIELVEGMVENESEKKLLENFFDEPYPNKSMISIRRELRSDLESTGNGYLEVIENLNREVMMLNHLSSTDVRLVRYDDPVVVSRALTRGGKEVDVKVRARERRFVQMVNGKKVYFKEFQASRDLDRDTGKWAKQGESLPIEKRASSVIHFVVSKEAKTPYGSPRWINQLPSVLGSRKAEEFNLDFFDSGGLPPVVVIVQGGYLADGVKDSLQAHLSGSGAKHRAAIVEAISSSGSLDSSGSVKVSVERFGAERMQDAMFQQYDKNTEDHVRASFRLPPLFTGRAQDYNFATALTGYMTAEAQVFAPERLEFDERMRWVVKALGIKSYTFKSKPMVLINVDNQLKAIELVMTNKNADGEGVITALNALTGLHLKYEKPPEPPAPIVGVPDPTALNQPTAGQKVPGATTPKPNDSKASTPPKSKETPDVPEAPVDLNARKSDKVSIVQLADQWANALGLSGPCLLTQEEMLIVKGEVSALQSDDLKLFTEIMASKNLVGAQVDFEGLASLCGVAHSMGE